MDGSKVAALAIAGLALLALIPAFNSLNQATVVELKPPIDIDDPPENFEPPDNMDPPDDLPEGEWEGGTPPPGVACGPAKNEQVYRERFQASSTGGQGEPSERIHVNGAVGGLGIIVNWSGYRGNADVLLEDPSSETQFESGTVPSDYLEGKSGSEGEPFEQPAEGYWRLRVANQGFGGSFTVDVILHYPCGDPADAPTTGGGNG